MLAKMTKNARKKTKVKISKKKTQKTLKDKTKAAECVKHLLELHKVQGVLLVQLSKEV